MGKKSTPHGAVQYFLDQKLINNKQLVLCLNQNLKY